MFKMTPKLSTALGALLISVALAAPAFAADPAAQPAAPAATATQPHHHHHHGMQADDLEARIAKLHDQLHVTDAQTADWNAVAQIMRDNRTAIHDLASAKHAQAATMSAVDDLNAYAEIAAKHAELTHKLAASFETFYGTLSPDQKKAADDAFRQHKQQGMHGQQH